MKECRKCGNELVTDAEMMSLNLFDDCDYCRILKNGALMDSFFYNRVITAMENRIVGRITKAIKEKNEPSSN